MKVYQIINREDCENNYTKFIVRDEELAKAICKKYKFDYDYIETDIEVSEQDAKKFLAKRKPKKSKFPSRWLSQFRIRDLA